MSSCMEGGGTDCFYGREVGREKSIGFENTSAVGSGKGESLELWHFSKDRSKQIIGQTHYAKQSLPRRLRPLVSCVVNDQISNHQFRQQVAEKRIRDAHEDLFHRFQIFLQLALHPFEHPPCVRQAGCSFVKMFGHQCFRLGEQAVGAAALEDACDLGPFGRGAVLHAVDEGERDFAFVQVLAGAFLPGIPFFSPRRQKPLSGESDGSRKWKGMTYFVGYQILIVVTDLKVSS